MNYFKLFKIPQKIELDINNLTIKYYKLQKKFHPDTYEQKKHKKTDNKLYLKNSILLNKGYCILKNILTRAEHLLFLNNIKKNINKESFLDSNFLKIQLKLFEEIKQNKDKKDKILIQIKKDKKIYIEQLKMLCNKKKWILAHNILCKLFFINKLINNIKEIND